MTHPPAGLLACTPDPVVRPAPLGGTALSGWVPVVAPLAPSEWTALGRGDVVVRDRVLDPVTCLAWHDALVDWAHAGRMSHAAVGLGRSLRPQLRGDHTCWVEPDDLPGVHPFFDAVREVLREGLRVALDGQEIQAACYPGDGARYVRHVDALREDPARRFTALVYLNPGWRRADGGTLQAWTPEGLRRIAPRAGRLVIFRSDAVPHAVLPTHAPRFALTAWFRGP